MRRLPPLNALRAFEAAARCGGISAAASELGVTHSAISQQVLQLERYFGQKLFHRPGKRIEPTASALALLEDVRASLDRIAVACNQLGRRGLDRIITINAPSSFAMLWLLPRAAVFQRKHPHLELRVSTYHGGCDALQLDGPYDFIVRRFPMKRNGHVCSKLLDDAAVPMMSPQLDLTIERPEQLENLNLIHTKSWPDAWQRWLAQHAGRNTQTIDGPFFDHTALALQAALNGLGIAIAPRALADEYLADGRLISPLGECEIRGSGYHIMHALDAANERGPREFLHFLEMQQEAPQLCTAMRSQSQFAAASW
ncbi:MAG: LysR family transcriptional regulator [Hyphomonadaceae bacterium]|nr:LysR family transcriptional regulator [Hyphomonadaceae bacterium]